MECSRAPLAKLPILCVPLPQLSAALMFDAVHVVVSAVRELNRSQEIGVKPLACTSANIWPHGTSLMNYLRMVSRVQGGWCWWQGQRPSRPVFLCHLVAFCPPPRPPFTSHLSLGLSTPCSLYLPCLLPLVWVSLSLGPCSVAAPPSHTSRLLACLAVLTVVLLCPFLVPSLDTWCLSLDVSSLPDLTAPSRPCRPLPLPRLPTLLGRV